MPDWIDVHAVVQRQKVVVTFPAMPVQVPVVALRVFPTCATPLSAGIG